MEDDWIDVTVMGGAYEEQLHLPTGRRRRRSIIGRLSGFQSGVPDDGGWEPVPTDEGDRNQEQIHGRR